MKYHNASRFRTAIRRSPLDKPGIAVVYLMNETAKFNNAMEGGNDMPEPLTVEFDNEVLLVTNMTSKEFINTTKFTMAAKLWMDGKITAGQAAKMCGMGKVDFLYELPKHGYPMSNLGPDDLAAELAFARSENPDE